MDEEIVEKRFFHSKIFISLGIVVCLVVIILFGHSLILPQHHEQAILASAIVPTATPTFTPTPTIMLTPTPTLIPTPTATPTATPTPFPTANPEDVANWDKLAGCETHGNWAEDTGNGYFGGLQFSQSAWLAVGGTGKPSDATRDEQILRAKTLFSHQGWGAWSECARRVGLY